MSFFCWKCNGELPDGMSVCPNCQAPVDKTIVGQMETIVDNDEARIQIMTGVTVADRYEIKAEIGRGGMGVVYLAFDKTLEREVALKVISCELCQDPRAVKNLKRETTVALGLSHPQIVRIHNLETWEGQAFVTMEYVRGGTLAHLLDKHDGFLGFDKALPLIKEIASALDYAHQQRPPVIHRDLKPLNILITAAGHAKIADYGLAHGLKDSATRISMSPTAGTLAYMAPEQLRGRGIGPKTDIYAFACLICEILTGDPPFTTGDLRWQIIHEEPVFADQLPPQVKAMLMVALAKDPARRPASAGVLVAGLTESESPVVPLTGSGFEPADKLQAKNPSWEKDRLESLSRMGVKPQVSEQYRERQKPARKSRESLWSFLIFLLGAGIAAVLISSVIQPAPVPLAGVESALTREQTPTPAPEPVSEPAAAAAPVKAAPAGNVHDDSFKRAAAFSEKRAELYLYSEPAGARIRILNIRPVFSQGMELEAGSYQIEVSQAGYRTKRQWLKLKAGESKSLTVTLMKEAVYTPSGQPFTEPLTGMEFVWVKGGCFRMGSNAGDADDDEQPVHRVCVDGFWIGKYEVTRGQWRKMMDNNPSEFKKGANYPVEKVSWDDCQEFIKKLNRKSGKNFRLPTEAEWEYACRSGGRDEKYSGGGDVNQVAWYDANSGLRTHPVGGKAANQLGLYDMSGNVYEWCLDWYGEDYYGRGPVRNPQGPDAGSCRVLRGGSWGYLPGRVRSACRFRFAPAGCLSGFGFRLVVVPGRR